MEKPTAIQDFLQITDLPPRTLLIENVTPGIQFDRSTDFFEDFKTLIGYRKRRTSTKVDFVQTDLCMAIICHTWTELHKETWLLLTGCQDAVCHSI